MQVACVLISHFSFKAESLRQPDLRHQRCLIVRMKGSWKVVADCSPSLSTVRPDMPLQQALTSVKKARLIEADDAYYHDLYRDILEALEQVSPIVEESDLGCAYVDLVGLEGLYGGDAQVALALQRALPDHWGAQIGIGNGKFVAHIAALSARPQRPVKAPDDTASYLKGFSLDILPVSYKTKARLREFALHTLGDVATVPVGPLQAQFGLEGKLIWELANGIDNRQLIPRRTDEEVTESLTFPVPTATLEALLIGAEVLLERALLRPELSGRLARVLTLKGEVYRGIPWTKRLSFKEPTRDKRRVMARIKAGLEGVGLADPVEELSLTLSDLTGDHGRQESLFSEVRNKQQLQETMKALQALLGGSPPVFQVRELEPWSR
ncbi:MAG: hypothetical protein V3T78_08840, partial [Dehalococcoidia bacterium]